MKKQGNGFFYLNEVLTMLRLNKVSNGMSLLSNALIYLILGLVLTGTLITNFMVKQLQEEAEISVYLIDGAQVSEFEDMVSFIETIDGVDEVTFVEEDVALTRMEKILGEDAQVLDFFETNPFDAFIEVGIDMSAIKEMNGTNTTDKIDTIIVEIETKDSVEMIRENRDVLEKITQISVALNSISILIVIAVGITTLVTLSYVIRQSIFHYREKIQTLFLLGAPTYFVSIPFYLMGLLMSFIASGFAVATIMFIINRGYEVILGPLPFIALPDQKKVLFEVSLLLGSLSIILGLLGSFFGMRSVKKY